MPRGVRSRHNKLAPSGEAARAWYAETKMPLFTWSSVAQGFFSGRVTRTTADAVREDFPESSVHAYWYEQNWLRLDRVEELSAEKGLSVTQIALAYVHNLPLNLFTLVGCRSREECQANIEALSVKLTPEEMAWLDLKRDER